MSLKSSSLTIQTAIVAVQTPVMSELAGEAVILDPVSGIYYGLNNEVAIRIWQLIQQPIQINDVCNSILSEYDVDPQQCQQDILGLIQDLMEHHLAEICNDKGVV